MVHRFYIEHIFEYTLSLLTFNRGCACLRVGFSLSRAIVSSLSVQLLLREVLHCLRQAGADAAGVVLTDALPSGTVFARWVDNSCGAIYAADQITWQRGP